MLKVGGSVAADEDGVVRREHHVQELAHVVGGSRQVVLDDAHEVAGRQALLQLLDGLHADALDAQQILLGMTQQVGHGLDARLGELVRPALGHAQIVVDVQARVLVGQVVAAVAPKERCSSHRTSPRS